MLDEMKLAALVANSHATVLHLTGTAFLTQRVLRERLAFLVVTLDAEPILIFERIEAEHAESESTIRDLRPYDEYRARPIELLAAALVELGVDDGRIGFEGLNLGAKHYLDLRAALPNVTLIDVDPALQALRAVKTPEEMEILAAGALHTDAAIRAGLMASTFGDSEDLVASRIVTEAMRLGGRMKGYITLVTGPNAFKAHHYPDQTPLLAGSLVRVDSGMLWQGYLSDIARTAFVSPITKAQSSTYRRLAEVQQVVIDAMQPGVRCSHLYELCRAECEKQHLSFSNPHIGHSVGLNQDNVHEAPVLHPYEDAILKPGMAISVEPLVVGEDGKYHLEDLVEVTDDGPRVLSRSADWSEPLVIG